MYNGHTVKLIEIPRRCSGHIYTVINQKGGNNGDSIRALSGVLYSIHASLEQPVSDVAGICPPTNKAHWKYINTIRVDKALPTAKAKACNVHCSNIVI